MVAATELEKLSLADLGLAAAPVADPSVPSPLAESSVVSLPVKSAAKTKALKPKPPQTYKPEPREVLIWMSRFVGKKDTYAKFAKFERNGKWERLFMPAREKPKQTVAGLQDGDLQPLTPDAVRKHLTGEQPIGVYVLIDEKFCRFFALDFDGYAVLDVMRVRSILLRYGLASYMASSTRRGYHLYIFFKDMLPASRIRPVIREILYRHKIVSPGRNLKEQGIDLFPAQSSHAGGGFGNLIRPPMTRAAFPYKFPEQAEGGSETGHNILLNIDGSPMTWDGSFATLEKATLVEPERVNSLLHELDVEEERQDAYVASSAHAGFLAESPVYYGDIQQIPLRCKRIRDIIQALRDPANQAVNADPKAKEKRPTEHDWSFGLVNIFAYFGEKGRKFIHDASMPDAARYNARAVDDKVRHFLSKGYTPSSCKKSLACPLHPFNDCHMPVRDDLPVSPIRFADPTRGTKDAKEVYYGLVKEGKEGIAQ